MSDNKQKKAREVAGKIESAADPAQTPDTAQGAEQGKTGPVPGSYRPRSSARKPIFARKWMYPATYLAAAAIILALMWVVQDIRKPAPDQADPVAEQAEQQAQLPADEDALPAGAPAEHMQWPADPGEADVVMPYYDAAATHDEKQSAIMQQGNRFAPNTGIVMAREDNGAFDVRAALSGEVTRSEKVPAVGNLVEITHEDGLRTIYYSLADVEVRQGDAVAQGDRIGKAGRNEMGKDFGVHLHFEVHKDGEPVNPAMLLGEPGAADADADMAEVDTEAGAEAEPGDDADQTEMTEQ